MHSLKIKVAVVTGGAQSIGLGICEALGAAGSEVIVADIHQERLKRSCEELLSRGHRCHMVEVEITNEESVRNLVQQAKTRHGRIDIFVNCAGVPPNVVRLIHLTTAEWIRLLNVNLTGVFFCCREVGVLMVQQESGKIVNIASLNAGSPVGVLQRRQSGSGESDANAGGRTCAFWSQRQRHQPRPDCDGVSRYGYGAAGRNAQHNAGSHRGKGPSLDSAGTLGETGGRCEGRPLPGLGTE